MTSTNHYDGMPDVQMLSPPGAWNDDVRMETMRNTATNAGARQSKFKLWERELLESAEVKEDFAGR